MPKMRKMNMSSDRTEKRRGSDLSNVCTMFRKPSTLSIVLSAFSVLTVRMAVRLPIWSIFSS